MIFSMNMIKKFEAQHWPIVLQICFLKLNRVQICFLQLKTEVREICKNYQQQVKNFIFVNGDNGIAQLSCYIYIYIYSKGKHFVNLWDISRVMHNMLSNFESRGDGYIAF